VRGALGPFAQHLGAGALPAQARVRERVEWAWRRRTAVEQARQKLAADELLVE
jgi:hypothetical protein